MEFSLLWFLAIDEGCVDLISSIHYATINMKTSRLRRDVKSFPGTQDNGFQRMERNKARIATIAAKAVKNAVISVVCFVVITYVGKFLNALASSPALPAV